MIPSREAAVATATSARLTAIAACGEHVRRDRCGRRRAVATARAGATLRTDGRLAVKRAGRMPARRAGRDAVHRRVRPAPAAARRRAVRAAVPTAHVPAAVPASHVPTVPAARAATGVRARREWRRRRRARAQPVRSCECRV